MMEQSVGVNDALHGSNVQNGTRDEYSTKVCAGERSLARQWLGDEVGVDRGSVGIVFGDTVPRGYPDDVSGRLNISICEKAEPQCGEANREHWQARCAGRHTLY